MEFNRDSTGIEERAKMVFSLGSTTMALLLAIFMLFLMLLLSIVFEKPLLQLILFSASLAFMTASSMKSSSFMNFRRSMWASLIAISPQMISYMMLLPLGAERMFTRFLYSSLYLAGLITLIMDRKARKVVFMASSLIPSIIDMRVVAVALPSSALSLLLTYKIIKKVSSIGGENPAKVLSHLLLSSDPEPLEEVLERLSPEGEVTSSVILLGDVAIVTANFHPGPLIAGSSGAPARIITELEGNGYRPIFLRAASTHASNLPSKKEVEKVINEIKEGIMRADECRCSYAVRRSNKFDVTAQRFGDLVLATVSGRSFGSFEDLPSTVERRINDILRAKGCKIRVIVVDRHDSLLPEGKRRKIDPFSDEEDELINLLLDAISEVECNMDRIRAGYSTVDVKLRSIGKGGVRVAVVGNAAYICFDSNNMLPELRDMIAERVEREGLIPVIATTDTHDTLGVRETANPAGIGCDKSCLVKVADAVRDAVLRAKESGREVKARVSLRKVRIKVVGGDLMRDIIRKAEEADYSIPLVLLGLIPAQMALLFIF